MTNEIAPNFDPSVGIYLDGVYAGTTIGAILSNYLDVDRVEVLKGPQGTLYGRNTTGGAFSIYTKLPTDKLEGEISAGYGVNDLKELKGVLNLPLSSAAGLRLVGSYSGDDGYGRDVGQHRPLADQTVKMLRGTFQLALPADTDLIIRSDWQQGETSGFIVNPRALNPGSPANAELAFKLYGPAGLAPGGTGLQDALNVWNQDVQGDPYKTTYAAAVPSDSKVTGTSATLTHDFGPVAFKSVTAYRETASHYDAEWSPFIEVDHILSYTEISQFTQEFQLNGRAFDDRLNYVGGVFYYDQDFTDYSTHNVFPLLGGPVVNYNAKGGAESWALYTQGTYSLTDALRLTAGLRYTQEDKNMKVSNYTFGACSLPPSLIAPGSCELKQDISENNVSYTAGIDWTPVEDLMLYAKVSSGFKSGGLQLRVTFSADSATPFDSEKVTEYEVGVKSQWWDNRLRVNVAAYHSNYSDIQRLDLVFGGPAPAPVTKNAAKATIDGLELETQLQATERLLLSATAALVDPSYESYVYGGVDVSNQKFQNQPKMTYSLAAAHTLPLPIGELRTQIDWYWRSDVDLFPSGTAPDYAREQGAYSLLNGRLAWELPDQGLTLSIWGKNLLDKEYDTTVIDLYADLGTTVSIPGAPRTYGAEVRKTF